MNSQSIPRMEGVGKIRSTIKNLITFDSGSISISFRQILALNRQKFSDTDLELEVSILT